MASSRQLIKRVTEDGWQLDSIVGSHHHFHQIDSRVAKDSRFKSRSAFLAESAQAMLQR